MHAGPYCCLQLLRISTDLCFTAISTCPYVVSECFQTRVQ
uniref:Uncharacterized protein n=1 Tax=Anguilla anguilla TaxID=7936 RepID=A0A0E9Q7L0_ANGAN